MAGRTARAKRTNGKTTKNVRIRVRNFFTTGDTVLTDDIGSVVKIFAVNFFWVLFNGVSFPIDGVCGGTAACERVDKRIDILNL